jgi:hypothetical protein
MGVQAYRFTKLIQMATIAALSGFLLAAGAMTG